MSTTFQITTVTNATDTFTKVGHGLTTGVGPGCLRLGVNSVIPAGAAELTDYWPIVVDADNFKLANSQANALANVPINITSDGSGVILFELGLPYRSQTTYVAGTSQVKSADLNSLQGDWKSLHALLTGQAQTPWTFGNAISGVRSYDPSALLMKATNWALNGDFAAVTTNGLLSSAAGDADFCLSRVMFEGQPLKSVTMWMAGDGAVDVTATVYQHDFTNAVINNWTVTSNNIPALPSLTFVTVNNINVKAGQLSRLYMRVNANAANALIMAVMPNFTP